MLTGNKNLPASSVNEKAEKFLLFSFGISLTGNHRKQGWKLPCQSPRCEAWPPIPNHCSSFLTGPVLKKSDLVCCCPIDSLHLVYIFLEVHYLKLDIMFQLRMYWSEIKWKDYAVRLITLRFIHAATVVVLLHNMHWWFRFSPWSAIILRSVSAEMTPSKLFPALYLCSCSFLSKWSNPSSSLARKVWFTFLSAIVVLTESYPIYVTSFLPLVKTILNSNLVLQSSGNPFYPGIIYKYNTCTLYSIIQIIKENIE